MPTPDVALRTTEIDAPIAIVHALLADPHALVEVHPLIHAIRVTGARVVDGWHSVSFDIEERIPIGPFGWPNRYTGEVRTREGDLTRIVLGGRSFPSVVVETEVRLAPVGEGRTRIDQETRVSAPALVRGFVVRTARKAHDRAFARTKEIAEARATAAGTTRAGPENA